MPKFPSTSKPFVGAVFVPEYVDPITAAPSTSNLFTTLVVPIPTLPSTIIPLLGAAVVPEYVLPIATPPSTSNLDCGVAVPIPTLPEFLIRILSVSFVPILKSWSLWTQIYPSTLSLVPRYMFVLSLVSLNLPPPAALCTCKGKFGLSVPIPTFPLLKIHILSLELALLPSEV